MAQGEPSLDVGTLYHGPRRGGREIVARTHRGDVVFRRLDGTIHERTVSEGEFIAWARQAKLVRPGITLTAAEAAIVAKYPPHVEMSALLLDLQARTGLSRRVCSGAARAHQHKILADRRAAEEARVAAEAAQTERVRVYRAALAAAEARVVRAAEAWHADPNKRTRANLHTAVRALRKLRDQGEPLPPP